MHLTSDYCRFLNPCTSGRNYVPHMQECFYIPTLVDLTLDSLNCLIPFFLGDHVVI